MNFYQKDLLSTLEWTDQELATIIAVAKAMKQERFSSKFNNLLRHKTFAMLFFNPSVRTRSSFETAATELGGHAQFLEPRTMRLCYDTPGGETLKDVAHVLSRYMAGVGIRILEDKISQYGEGHHLLKEFAQHATVPVINMGNDLFHPCQGLADVMGLQEHLGALKGKKILVTWAKGTLARSRYSVQEILLMSSRFGMNVVLAYPEGYGLDPAIITQSQKNCEVNGTSLNITHDPITSYDGVQVVYSRNWVSPDAYKHGYFDKVGEIQKALDPKYAHWICTSEKMSRTDNALFLHPMPVDRGNEVSDDVASGNRSIIYEVAENRLHVQKAIMALTMNEGFSKKCAA